MSAITAAANDPNDFTIFSGTLTAYKGTDEVVTIPDNVTAIGDRAFQRNNTLKSVIIPGSVLSIGDDAFYSCKSLDSIIIPDSVESIGNKAFMDCSDLESVVIGSGVETIGNDAFLNCEDLESVTFKGEVPPTFGTGVFAGTHSLKTIYVPKGATAAYVGLGSYTIVEMCMVCEEIPCVCADFTIVDGVLTAYTGAGGDIIIPKGVTAIGDSVFRNNSTITGVVIPDSVKSIGAIAFGVCSNLKSVVIGNGVGSIGNYAFQNCENLESVVIGNNVESISNYAFQNCTNLESVVIGNGVKTIGEYAFQNCTSMTSVVIANNVESIGESAFFGCSNMTSVIFPESVTSIGATAFFNCTNLKSLTFQSATPPTTIGVNAFSYFVSPSVIPIEGITVYVPITSKALYEGVSRLSSYDIICILCKEDPCVCDDFEIDTDGVLTEYKGTDTAVTIPKGVRAIGYQAFWKNTTIKSVIIHDSVLSIGDAAFNGCTGMTSVVIGNGVKTIGEYAFRDCSSLESVIIPDSVESIGDNAFMNCVNMTSVVIGNNVESIGNSAFHGCTSLKNVIIPDSVKTIESGMFNGCTDLESVVIGSGVESIGYRAFWDCTKLETVTFMGITPPTFPYAEVFPCVTGVTVYIPIGTKAAYEAIEQLQGFDIIVLCLDHSFTTYTDDTATCTVAGIETATCDYADCAVTDERATSALGHDFQDYIPDNNASCLQDGTETAICEREDCTEEDVQIIANSMLPHVKNDNHCTKCVLCGNTVFARSCTEDEPCERHATVPPTGLGDVRGFGVVAVVLVGVSAGLWGYSRRRRA